MTVVVGLDLSLTGSGICRIEGEAIQHARIGSGPASAALADRSQRLRVLAGKIVERCVGADLVGVESPAYSKTMGSMHDRSGLWWMVMGRLTAQGIACYEVTAGTLKVYATGAGRVGKDLVLAEVVRRYIDHVPNLATNDEADALVIAAMGFHHATGGPVVALPRTHTRALAAVKWPNQPQEK